MASNSHLINEKTNCRAVRFRPFHPCDFIAAYFLHIFIGVRDHLTILKQKSPFTLFTTEFVQSLFKYYIHRRGDVCIENYLKDYFPQAVMIRNQCN